MLAGVSFRQRLEQARAQLANSTVSLHSYDIETRKTKDIVLPGNPDYIPRIVYGPKPSQLLVA